MNATSDTHNENKTRWLIPIYISFFSIILDFTGFLVSSGKLNYLPLFVIFYLVATANSTSIGFMNMKGIRFMLALFLFFGCFLSTYMKILTSKDFSYMSMFLPAIILIINNFQSITFKANVVLKIFFFIGLVFEIECVLAAENYLPQTSILNFTYEKLYIEFFAMILCGLFKQYAKMGILLMGYLTNFIIYPAGSYLIPIIVLVGLFYIIKMKIGKLFFYVSVILVGSVITANIFYFERIAKLSQKYYDYVGKTNNNEFRNFLLKITLAKIRENILFGSLYRTEPSSTSVNGANIVSHNDYLNMVLGGGIFILLLFVIVSMWIVSRGLQAIQFFTLGSDYGKFVFALTAIFLSILILSNFSALLSKPNNSIAFYSIGITILNIASRCQEK